MARKKIDNKTAKRVLEFLIASRLKAHDVELQFEHDEIDDQLGLVRLKACITYYDGKGYIAPLIVQSLNYAESYAFKSKKWTSIFRSIEKLTQKNTCFSIHGVTVIKSNEYFEKALIECELEHVD